MSQTRTGSLIEAVANVAIGFGISFAANAFVLPIYGYHITPGHNLQIGLIFTVISVVRSYSVRRLFNRVKLSLLAKPR